MIDQWEPNRPTAIDPSILRQLAECSQTLITQGEQGLTLPADILRKAQQWIHMTETQWQEALPQFDQNTLLALAEFYTVAEMVLPGWQAKDKNPTIWIFRYLKKQQQLPEKDVIRALKARTDNRFIPYGSAL